MNINLNNHVFLVQESKFSDVHSLINEIMMSFCCKDKCKNCNACKKIINKTYFDYFYINSEDSDVRKRLDQMKDQFSYQGLEISGYKFYIIKNVESLNKVNVNLLLKFIEEPPTKTIGIFTTKNKHLVIDTIRSRCEEMSLKQNINEAKKIIEEKYKNEDIEFLTNSFFSLEDIEEFMNSENKDNIINVYNFLKKKNPYNEQTNKILSIFKLLNYKEISHVINGIKSYYNSDKYIQLSQLINDLRYNLNKTLVFNKILDIIYGE